VVAPLGLISWLIHKFNYFDIAHIPQLLGLFSHLLFGMTVFLILLYTTYFILNKKLNIYISIILYLFLFFLSVFLSLLFIDIFTMRRHSPATADRDIIDLLLIMVGTFIVFIWISIFSIKNKS